MCATNRSGAHAARPSKNAQTAASTGQSAPHHLQHLQDRPLSAAVDRGLSCNRSGNTVKEPICNRFGDFREIACLGRAIRA